MCTLVLTLLFLGCDKDDGFGADGNRVEPPNDTGPFNTNTGDDTGSDTTDTDPGTVDTADSADTADSGDTGLGIEGTGYKRGDVAYNLIAPDQDDDDWALYGQYGRVIILTFGDATDPNFQEISGWLGSLGSQYGIATAAFLLTDSNMTQADVDAAESWSDTHSLPTVLYRPTDGSVSTASWASTPPMTYVIDQEMVIDWTNQGNTEQGQIEDKVKDLVLGK